MTGYIENATAMVMNITLSSFKDTNTKANMSSNDTIKKALNPVMEFTSPPLKVEEIVTLPFYSLIFILSVVGNLLVIITLIQNKRMRTVTNVFLLNLSISDLLLAVFCMPFTIVPIMLKNFIFGATMCILIRYMQSKYLTDMFN